ncbi:MAG TPA: DMT family transporter [Casimicrobiaceae bacterium]|nr:DMT family transporter [Casimicrobiaceae bacterium]
MPATRHPLDVAAVASMLVLTALWGFQQVAVKLAAHGVSLVMQGAIRSALACVLVVAWSRLRGVPLLARDGTLVPGVLAGVLFGAEFAMIYAGLAHTTAARMVVFLYLAPCLTALGLALLVPGETLAPVQWAGVALAFAGIAFAFGEGAEAGGRATWLGDALGVAAAFGWAATTVLIRATPLARIRAEKTLAYQLAVSAPLMLAVSLALGEPGVVQVTPVAVASLAFQTVVVAFASYLTWFWLLTRYLASRLAVFSFAAPLFGVAFGHLVLGDPLTVRFLAAAVLVGAGIVMVNVRRA